MDTSYLAQQVTTIIGKLHTLFDEIGVASHERDSRESELFSSLSETLHNHLRMVAGEKNDLVEEGKRLITTIKQMEASLEDSKPNKQYANQHDDLKVTYPLLESISALKEKHQTVGKLHQERYEQVKQLTQALESYSSHLEPSFLKVKLPPVTTEGTVPPTFDLSPSYIASVDAEFSRVYEEYHKRITTVQQTAEEIIKLWAELGTPQAQTDASIIKHWRDSPEQLGLRKDDVAALTKRRDKIQDEKRGREKRIKELRGLVEGLWDRLGVEDRHRKEFLAANRGCGLRAINDLEDELSRLNDLKRQNLHLFVEDARTRIQTLWDELFFSEEEAVEFTPMFCDVFSDALLSAHEAEISRLENLKQARAPMIDLISRHRSLVKDRDDLNASSQDASRLLAKGAKGEKRDPTRLLREEKMRKRIAKDLPKLEAELSKALEKFEDEYGRPFLVFGERYLDVLEESSSKVPPPRSKTPSAMQQPVSRSKTPNPGQQPPRAKTPNLGQASAKLSRPANANKAMHQSREPPRETPAFRAKTPVGTATLGRNQVSPGKSNTANKSPSRIPARVPLNSRQDGGNSPERQYQADRAKAQTLRERPGPPMMAPPPKMRDVFAAPTSTPSSDQPDDPPPSGSVVRHAAPEDPYSDHPAQRSYYNSLDSNITRNQPHSQSYQHMPPPPRPDYHQSNRYHHEPAYATSSTASTYSDGSRQISATSSHTTVSSSENWESYDDDDGIYEPEPDARRDYFAKVRATSGKRYASDEDASDTVKRYKAFQGQSNSNGGSAYEQADASTEAGWADGEVF